MTRSSRNLLLQRIVLIGGVAAASLVLSCGGGNGAGGGGMMPGAPTVQPNIIDIQAKIFTPKCALVGCHTGATPQPLQGAGLDLTLLASLDSLLGPVDPVTMQRPGLASTLDPNFLRVVDGDPANSYLYMKTIGDARTAIPINPGVCSVTTGTTCLVDADCPVNETCSLVGGQMPKNAPALTLDENRAIFQWIRDRIPGSTGPPGY